MTNFSSSLIFCLIFVLLFNSSHGGKIDILREEYGTLPSKAHFYNEEYLNGLQLDIQELERGECKNFPKRWLNKARSVDTLGTCIQACSELECDGICTLIYPNNGEQRLADIKFDQKISSVKRCFD